MRKSFGLLVLAVLMIITFSRNRVWIDDGTLWTDTIGKSPKKSRAYNEFGLHVLDSKQYGRALMLFSKSLELDPYQSPMYINLGLAYEGLGRIDKAIRSYERAIFVDPKEPAPHYNLGVLYYNKLHDRQKALGYFLKARDLDPFEPDVHQYLGVIYREMGEYQKANEESMLYRRLK